MEHLPNPVKLTAGADLTNILARMIEYQLNACRITSPSTAAADVVDSIITLGITPPEQKNTLISEILGQIALKGDLNKDGRVDVTDVQILTRAIGKKAEGPADPILSHCDGKYTVLDARKLVTLCSLPKCAVK